MIWAVLTGVAVELFLIFLPYFITLCLIRREHKQVIRETLRQFDAMFPEIT